MSEMAIGEVARRTGLRTSALRYYEAQGILPAPRREGGRRRYDPGVLPWISMLRFAQQAGFTLDEIRVLLNGFGEETRLGERWQALARAKLREVDALIARATEMRAVIEAGLSCDCASVQDCMAGDPAAAAGSLTPP